MPAILHSNKSAKDRPQKYDGFSRALHWIFAIAILYTMVAGYSLHIITDPVLWRFVSTLNMSLATCLIVLFPVRYIWSFFRKEPKEIKTIPPLQRAFAHLAHSLIYGLMAFVLISGFIMVPDGYWLFGVLYIPTIYTKGIMTDYWFDLHKMGCYSLTLMVLLHIGAALKHHFVMRNGVLRKML